VSELQHRAARAWSLVCALSLGAIWASRQVHAESVPIGRYAELVALRAAGHPYATTGGDPQRTGRSSAHAPARAPLRKWGVTLSQRALTPPAVRADGTLIIGHSQGVVALDAAGTSLWNAALGAVRFTPALMASGEAVVIAAGRLQVLATDGHARELALPTRVRGLPLVLESGAVVVGGVDGQAHVVALDGGYVANVQLADDSTRFSAWIGDDLLVMAGQSAALTLLSPQGGREHTVRLQAPLASHPLATAYGTFVAITATGSVIEITRTGAVSSWAEVGAGMAVVPPAMGRDRGLRVGLRHGDIVCFDPGGKERWRRGIDGQPGAMLLDADDKLLVVSSRGTLYAIDRAGDLRYRQRTELIGAGRPVLGGDGLLYLVGRGGRVEAWR